MPHILTINHHVPQDSSLSLLAFVDPAEEWGYHLCSPSPEEGW